MAVVDMPLEQLQEYMGKNPCPADFDSYWDSAISEIQGDQGNYELIKSEFQTNFAECFDLYFTGVQGARIHAKLLKPKKIEGRCPALLEFHGYTGSSGDWYTKLGYVANGFVVAALDCRGQGGESEDIGGVKGNTLHGHVIRGLDDSCENLYYRQVYLDCAKLARIVMDMEEVDEARVGARGYSQGGGLTLACAALVPEIKRLVPVYPFLSDYQRVWELDFETAAYIELRDYFRRFDPRHEREQEIFTRLGYIDVQHLAKRIKGEVLMGMTLRDDICPPSSQFAAYNKIESPKQMVLYPDFGHENLPGMEDKAFEFLVGM